MFNCQEMHSHLEIPEEQACYCLPKTSFMLGGCMCTKLGLWYKMDYWRSLCGKCSFCIRCGGTHSCALANLFCFICFEVALGFGVGSKARIPYLSWSTFAGSGCARRQLPGL